MNFWEWLVRLFVSEAVRKGREDEAAREAPILDVAAEAEQAAAEAAQHAPPAPAPTPPKPPTPLLTPMRKAVSDKFYAVNRRSELEGEVSYFYADTKGLVTIGVGCLVDPIETARNLPMLRKDGSLATVAEIEADWRAVKNDPLMAKEGHLRARRVTRLRLNEAGMNALLREKLFRFAGDLRKQFPGFNAWPADAQFALLSLSWARGQNNFAGLYPKLTRALKDGDFVGAAAECALAGGYKARNDMNKACFLAADRVVREGLDPEQLYGV